MLPGKRQGSRASLASCEKANAQMLQLLLLSWQNSSTLWVPISSRHCQRHIPSSHPFLIHLQDTWQGMTGSGTGQRDKRSKMIVPQEDQDDWRLFERHCQNRAAQTHPEQAAQKVPLQQCMELCRCSVQGAAEEAEPLAQGRAQRRACVALSQTQASSAKEKRWKFPPGLFSSLPWVCRGPLAQPCFQQKVAEEAQALWALISSGVSGCHASHRPHAASYNPVLPGDGHSQPGALQPRCESRDAAFPPSHC